MVFIKFYLILQSKTNTMRKAYYFLLVSLLSCVACQLNLKSNEEEGQAPMIEIERYDRLEYRYLTTGDFSALQEMNTEYAIETRMLIEDVLKLGTATDSEINTKLLKFYQDTTLQMLIADAETQYADMEDLNKELNTAFTKLKKWFPDMKIPQVYSQLADGIDESIVIGNQYLVAAANLIHVVTSSWGNVWLFIYTIIVCQNCGQCVDKSIIVVLYPVMRMHIIIL